MSTRQDSVMRALLAERGALVGYIAAIVGDPHLAEDVFQELALVVMRKADAAPVDQPERWLRRAARLEALATLRRRRRPVPLDEELLGLVDAAWDEDERRDARVGLVARLRACLDRLSPAARRLVTMRYEEGRCGQDMATAIGRPINTVYVTLSRIHRSLADCVAAGREDARER